MKNKQLHLLRSAGNQFPIGRATWLGRTTYFTRAHLKAALPRLRLSLSSALVLISIVAVQSAQIMWTNTTGGVWSDPLNWSPNQIPGPADAARITSNGTYVVTLDVDATVNRLVLGTSSGLVTLTNSVRTLTYTNTSVVGTNGILSMSGGALAGSSLLTVNGLLTWSGESSLRGGASLVVATNGVLKLAGNPFNRMEFQGAFTNHGTVTWESGLITVNSGLGNAGEIWNAADGCWDIQCDHGMAGSGIIHNAGLMQKTQGSGDVTISAFFDNSGIVEAQVGTIQFYNGGLWGGTFAAATGARVWLAGGDFTNVAEVAWSGTGTFDFTGGTLTLLNDAIPNLQLKDGTLILGPAFQGGTITNLTMDGARLAGTNTVSGLLTWSGWSTLNAGASLTVASTGVLHLAGNPFNHLQVFGILTNHGTVYWTDGNMSVQYRPDWGYTGEIWNEADGLWEIECDRGISQDPNPAWFHNAGTVRKSAGSGITSFNIQFANAGAVLVQSGTIQFDSSYANSPSANLDSSIGGPIPGTDYGQIQFLSPVTLDGAFSVSTRNGYWPNPGDKFVMLTYPSAANTPACLNGLDLGNGLRLEPKFTTTSLTLTAVAYATNTVPELFISASPSVVAVTWPLGFPDWTLESCENIGSPSWLPVTQACGNAAVLPASLAKQFFRLTRDSCTNGSDYTNWENLITNWVQTSAPPNAWTSVACAEDGSKLAVYFGGGICTSSNSGATWMSPVIFTSSWNRIAASVDGTTLLAANGSTLYTSTNSGGTWTLASVPASLSGCWTVAASGNGNTLAAGNCWSPGWLFLSTNSGADWTQASPTAGWDSISISENGTRLIGQTVYSTHFASSTNAGNSWDGVEVPFPAPWTAVAFSTDRSKLAAAVRSDGGGIYTSTNSDTAWTQTSAPNEHWQGLAASANGDILAAITSSHGIYVSLDSGVTWRQTGAPDTGWRSIVCSADGTKLFAVNSAGVWTAQATAQPIPCP